MGWKGKPWAKVFQERAKSAKANSCCAAAQTPQQLPAIGHEHARSPVLPVGLAVRLPRNLETRQKGRVFASFREKPALDGVAIPLDRDAILCVLDAIPLVCAAIPLDRDAILCVLDAISLVRAVRQRGARR